MTTMSSSVLDLSIAIAPMAGAAQPYGGYKRPHALTLAVYDPAAAEQRVNAANLSLSDVVVPFLTPPVDTAPINAVPLSVVAPRAEPAWIYSHFGLRLDLTVIPRLPRSPPIEEEELQQGRIQKRKKKQGKKHDGLPVVVCNVHAGTKQLQLTRWETSHGNIIKGEGYLDFITRSCFKEKDVVEIWAFKERRFHLFGIDMCHANPALHCASQERAAAVSVRWDGQVYTIEDLILDFNSIY
ncbi:hypothetical protein ZWY2020_004271 [Hordeum vulgare]|nr:hypothetical protein ZWY2020_004271 [Hordeum vulgare]